MIDEMCDGCPHLDGNEKYCKYWDGFLKNIDAYYYLDCEQNLVVKGSLTEGGLS